MTALVAAWSVFPLADAAAASQASLAPTSSSAPTRDRLLYDKRIYIANDDHTDYMWTATDVAYRQAFIEMLDFYMNQAETTATNPEHLRGRFNCDGSAWVWEYEHHRSAADFARLADHLRAGNITMPLNTLVLLYGSMPAEAVIRSMYYAGSLERRLDTRFPLVVPTENQALPGGIASLWAGSGARYAWKGVCNCATKFNAWDRPREIYWMQGPDTQRVLMKWNSQLWGKLSLGSYLEARNPNEAVGIMHGNAQFLDRWPWSVAGAFGKGGDDLKTLSDAMLTTARAMTTDTRLVQVSNEVDFFADFEATHGSEIETFRGSFGNEWDLYTATLAAVSGAFRRSVEKLRGAEALATIVALSDPTFLQGREAARDSAFLVSGLFYEHDWTADGPVPPSARAAWQRSLQRQFSGYVDSLHRHALARFASMITQPGGSERHLVFNPLSWVRTDVADLETALSDPCHVIDVTSGLEIPSQRVTVGGASRLRIRAQDVPSVGYRVYEVRPGSGTGFPPAAEVTLPAFDNGIYRVALGTRGQITSVRDHKDGDRELVAASGALFDLGSGTGSVVVEHSGPVSATLRVQATSSLRHDSRVTLHAGIDRIDLQGAVTENFGGTVGYANAFDLPGMTMRHEEVGMVARVGRNSQGGDYADQNTRTDYLTLNHFVDLSQAGRGVTLSSAESQFFRAGTSTVSTLDAATPSVFAVVGMRVDANLGFANQGGDALFNNRYALRTHGAYDQGAAMRFALEHQNPLITAPVTGSSGADLPQGTWSLIDITSPDVLLWALKPAEEGIEHGIIARVWNLAEMPRAFTLRTPGISLHGALHTTHIETDLDPISAHDFVQDMAGRQQMKTYRLLPQPETLAADTRSRPEAELAIAPNPVGAGVAAAIRFTLPRAAHARLTVHAVTGARVATLADGPFRAGAQRIPWSGSDAAGRTLAPGVYFLVLESENIRFSRRVVVLR